MPTYRPKALSAGAFRLPPEGQDISDSDKNKLHALLSGAEWESGYDGCLVLHRSDESVEAHPGDWIVRSDGEVVILDDVQFNRLFVKA